MIEWPEYEAPSWLEAIADAGPVEQVELRCRRLIARVQVLLYSTGLDDQEFVVAYETDQLERHHQLVVALRSTEARRYTLRDTPIFTAIHRPLDDALALVG